MATAVLRPRPLAQLFANKAKKFAAQPGASPFWTWFVPVWNKVNEERIAEVGPDRACAEWVLCCGGSVRWQGSSKHLKDYNSLPAGGYRRLKIEEVDGTDSCVNGEGFSYLKGCSELVRLKLHNCYYVDDFSLLELAKIMRSQLEVIELSRLGEVTEKGLINLTFMKSLKVALLRDLHNVQEEEANTILQHFKERNPDCKVYWPPYTGPLEDPADVLK